MSTQASALFVTSFDGMVKQAYQGQSKLRDTVRIKPGVIGSSHRFFKIGKGIAQPRVRLTDATPMNVSNGYADATLSDWQAPEYVDTLDINKLSFDEKAGLAQVIQGAMGRRFDQLVLDAMAASANATEVSNDEGGSNTDWNIEKILKAKSLMDDAGVPDGDRYITWSAIGLSAALLETQIGSSDYNTLKALSVGAVDSFAGFKFKMIETRDEGGLALATNNRVNFAWHKDAVGLAIGSEIMTKVDWVPEKSSWLLNGLFSAGAVTIDTNGVYKVNTYEA